MRFVEKWEEKRRGLKGEPGEEGLCFCAARVSFQETIGRIIYRRKRNANREKKGLLFSGDALAFKPSAESRTKRERGGKEGKIKKGIWGRRREVPF